MKIELVRWDIKFLDDLVPLANNYEVARNLRDIFPHPYRREDGRAFIQRVCDKDPTELFAILADGALAGGIGLHPQDDIYRKNAELGYWLGQPFWGRGIMTRAIGQIVPYGFATFDIDRVFAIPFHTNIGSIKALEKNGFRLEARLERTLYKDGRYFDELVYAIRRDSEK